MHWSSQVWLTYSGHESLLNAGILHRDISIGNIMLTNEEDDGYLIDFDQAIKLDLQEASGAPNKNGICGPGAYTWPHEFYSLLQDAPSLYTTAMPSSFSSE